MTPKHKPGPVVPSKDELVAYIKSQHDKVGIREIARAYGLKNENRAVLKTLLRELADEGKIARRKKSMHKAAGLPPVVLADVTTRDADGELIAVPADWDEDERGAPPKIRVVVPRRARPGEIPGVGDRALLRTEEVPEPDEDGIRFRGRPIKVLDKARHRVLGIFRALPDGSGRLVPVDKKSLGRELTIRSGDTGDATEGDLVAVDVARGRFGQATGKVKERLGSLASERAVSLIAIHAHGIPHVFSREVLTEADSAKPATLAGREDWREVPFVTIDPADAKDHDDAVFARPDSDPENPGGFVIDVAIADVAAYVRPGTAMDREALERGNSVYFPDRVVPMLPERISNDLCSLRPQEDRPALVARMVIGADGVKRRHTFHRVLMRSVARLHYAQAQAAADGHADDTTAPLLSLVLEPLYAAYEALKRARNARSPLDLDLPERKILLKPDFTVDRVIVPQRLEAHRLIEEYMILANVAAAETLERARTPLIYRVHDEPGLEKLNALREFLKTIDISLQKSGALRPAQFNGILSRVKGREYETLVNEVVLRSQAQAEYASENYGHFGLNLRRYAHFTSPIRRYADLVVHRALITAKKLGRDGLPDGTDAIALGEVAARISAAERRAMAAERETVDRLIAHHLADRIGATFQGHVGGVVRSGLFVKLDDTGADGFVPASTLGRDFYRYEEAQHALIGEATGESWRLGDPVTVKLVEAAPVAGALRFEIVSDGRIVPRPKGARHERPRSFGRGGRRR
ncbi:3'-to-5' exoribonuclease RNase R [Rhodovulum sp. PH10]|uniref:ribonuclease R n=1 Tax=Rhodovulum sp. PH10 TaxID=1187851 RepID=UPI00027C2C23|nr:ribonuclease R [Rhodovulum sp. PH10]EJW12064.1 3'-to-5' exoribonuclease RNase R [Rhodovulum sp. PH10]